MFFLMIKLLYCKFCLMKLCFFNVACVYVMAMIFVCLVSKYSERLFCV